MFSICLHVRWILVLKHPTIVSLFITRTIKKMISMKTKMMIWPCDAYVKFLLVSLVFQIEIKRMSETEQRAIVPVQIRSDLVSSRTWSWSIAGTDTSDCSLLLFRSILRSVSWKIPKLALSRSRKNALSYRRKVSMTLIWPPMHLSSLVGLTENEIDYAIKIIPQRGLLWMSIQ